MAGATGLVRGPLHPANALFPAQAKKKPWPPWRLIATHANSEFWLTECNYRTLTISNRNKKPLSGNSHFARASAFDLGLPRPLASS